MSMFDKIRKRNRASSETFAMVVDSYGANANGNSYVKGVRIDTGAQVQVMLRDLPENAKQRSSEFRRPEIADIQKKVKPGGILRIDSAFTTNSGPAEDGVTSYSARWIRVISRKPDQGAALTLPARVLKVTQDQESGKKRQAVEMLVPEKAIEIDDPAKFRDSLAEALSGEALQDMPSNTAPIAVIRLYDQQNPKDCFHLTVRARRVQQGEDWIQLRGKEALENLSDNTANLLEEIEQEYVGKEGIGITIVPGGMLRVGPMSISEDLSEPYEVSYTATDRNGQPQERSFTLFRQTVLGLRKFEDGENNEMFVISAAPVSYNAPMSRDGIDWRPKSEWEETAAAEAKENATERTEHREESRASHVQESIEDDTPFDADDPEMDFTSDVDEFDDLDDEELEAMVSKAQSRKKSDAALRI